LKECPLPGLLVASIFPAIIGRRLVRMRRDERSVQAALS
jgi:hypothetical protein